MNFLARQCHGETFGAFGSDDPLQQADVPFEHMLVEEQQRMKRLVLRGGADAALHGKVGKELFDFRFAHLVGVADMVKEDVTLDPTDVRCFGAAAVMTHANGCLDSVQQLRRTGRNGVVRHGDGLAHVGSPSKSGCIDYTGMVGARPVVYIMLI